MSFKGRKIDVSEAPAVNDVDWMAFERNPAKKTKEITVSISKSLTILGFFLGVYAILSYFQFKNTDLFDVFSAILAVWQFLYLTQGIPISISWIFRKIRFLSKSRRASFRKHSIFWGSVILAFFLLPTLQIVFLKLEYNLFLRNYVIFLIVLSGGLFLTEILGLLIKKKIQINGDDKAIFCVFLVNLSAFLVSAIPIGLIFSLVVIFAFLVLEKVKDRFCFLI